MPPEYSEDPTDDCNCGGEHPEWDYHTEQTCAADARWASYV